jgi:subtilisin family serine protease
MRPRQFALYILAAVTLFGSCRKEDVNSGNNSSTNNDDCFQSETVSASSTEVAGRFIVAYKNSALAAKGIATTERVKALSTDVLQKHRINPHALELNFAGGPGGFVATLSAEEAAALKNDDNVAAVEPDKIISLGSCFTVVAPRLVTWNVNRVGYGDGTGKRAWIIDTGIDFDHPDLTVDATLSKSFIQGVTSARDENGHGTHVAGIIGAKNNNIGVLGIASGATLISLRVLDKDGSGRLSNIIQALAYVNANASPGDVVNMSVGNDEGISEILDQQVRATAAKGIYIAIAAGNESKLANGYSPARTNADNVYTVSAVDSLDKFASFSNYGNDAVDYAAPGVRILSTFMNGKYAYMSGTSMAAPHVAGLLLLKGKNIKTMGTATNDPDSVPDPIAHY